MKRGLSLFTTSIFLFLVMLNGNAFGEQHARFIANRALWTQEDFESLLAGIMMKTMNSDIAIFEKEEASPVQGDLSHEVARARLKRTGNVSAITTTGKQIKDLAKLIAQDKQMVIFGLDQGTKTIHGRTINDTERFRVALSEKALAYLFGIVRVGGLSGQYADRAPFIEGVYSKTTELFFIAGPKVSQTFDTADSIKKAMNELKFNVSFPEMIDNYLSQSNPSEVDAIITYKANIPKSALTFNIAYLDLGLSHNMVNKVYDDYQGNGRFDVGRGKVAGTTHLFLNGKMDLTYDAPSLITTLGANIKFMQTDFSKKPEKDKTKLSLNFRLPWERSVFKDKSVVFSPIWNNSYDLTLAPLPFFTKQPHSFWETGKDKILPRTKSLLSLLGTNIDFTNLGFSVEVGGVLGADLNRSIMGEVFDYGPGLNFAGRWPLFGPLELSSTLTSYYLFPFVKSPGKDRLALLIDGNIWLRVARFHDFSISLMNDFFIASLQDAQKDLAISSIFGVTISLQRLFRILG